MNPKSEVERIKQVYRGYREEGRQSLWRLENPGNAMIYRERQQTLQALLDEAGFLPLTHLKVLEIGCGSGGVLATLLEWGALPENLYGVDLLADRIDEARTRYPGMHFECANAESLPYEDQTFDLVLFFTVFSSILDQSMRQNVARESLRVLKKTGAILWYDFRYNNPANPNVRGMTIADIRRLFPDSQMTLRTITLLPPLARRLGKTTPWLYPELSKVSFLRSHYAGLIYKNAAI